MRQYKTHKEAYMEGLRRWRMKYGNQTSPLENAKALWFAAHFASMRWPSTFATIMRRDTYLRLTAAQRAAGLPEMPAVSVASPWRVW